MPAPSLLATPSTPTNGAGEELSISVYSELSNRSAFASSAGDSEQRLPCFISPAPASEPRPATANDQLKRPFLRRGAGKARTPPPQAMSVKTGIQRQLRLQPREAFREAAQYVQAKAAAQKEVFSASTIMPCSASSSKTGAAAKSELGSQAAVAGTGGSFVDGDNSDGKIFDTPPQVGGRRSSFRESSDLTPEPIVGQRNRFGVRQVLDGAGLSDISKAETSFGTSCPDKESERLWHTWDEDVDDEAVFKLPEDPCPEEVVRQLQLEADLHLRALDDEICHFHRESEMDERLCALDAEIQRFKAGSQALDQLRGQTESAKLDLERQRKALLDGLNAQRRDLQEQVAREREDLQSERRQLNEELHRHHLDAGRERLELRERLERAEQALIEGERHWRATVEQLRRKADDLARANQALSERLQEQETQAPRPSTVPLKPRCSDIAAASSREPSVTRWGKRASKRTGRMREVLQEIPNTRQANDSFRAGNFNQSSDCDVKRGDCDVNNPSLLGMPKREHSRHSGSAGTIISYVCNKENISNTSSSETENKFNRTHSQERHHNSGHTQGVHNSNTRHNITSTSSVYNQNEPSSLTGGHPPCSKDIRSNPAISTSEVSEETGQGAAAGRGSSGSGRLLPDGRREMTFSNGLRKVVWPDGHTSVYFPNGDIKEKLSDGATVYHYHSTSTVQTTRPDGTNIYRFANGQLERHHPDGSKYVEFPDGTVKRVAADGSEEVTFPDGAIRRSPDNR